MKRLLFFMMFSLSIAHAQFWEWEKGYGIANVNYGHSITTDNDESVYSVGYYSDTISFEQINLGSSSPFSFSGFIVKQRPDNSVIWANELINAEPLQITSDDQYNLYVAGLLYSQAIIGGQTVMGDSINSSLFMAKLDSAGNAIWVNPDILLNVGDINDITVDNSGNTFITGYFNNDFILNGDTIASCSKDVFLIKYTSSGLLDWYKIIHACGKDGGMGVATDNSGSVYFTGNVGGATNDTIWLDSLFIINPNGYYVGKILSDGTASWFQGNSAAGGNDISINDNDEIFVAGSFSGTAYFGSDTLSSTLIDQFVNKMDVNGNVLWSKSLSNVQDTLSVCEPIRIECLTNSGFVLLNGFIGNVDFESASYNLSSSIVANSLQRFDGNGNLLFIRPIYGQYQQFYDLAIDNSNNEYTIGLFGYAGSPGNEFLAFGTDTILTTQGMNVVIAKLSDTMTVSIENILSDANFIVYPNPTHSIIQIRGKIPTNSSIELIDLNGKLMYKNLLTNDNWCIDISELNAGIYILRIVSETGVLARRIIKI